MDIEALRDKDIEVWVPFNDASILMRYVGLDELREIRQSATVRRWPRGEVEGQRQAEPEAALDLAEEGRLFGRAAVRGWKGLTLKGEEFPFSPDNCDLLISRWSEFARFVGEVSLDLKRLEHERMEKSKKKSLTTSAPEAIIAGSTATHAGT